MTRSISLHLSHCIENHCLDFLLNTMLRKQFCALPFVLYSKRPVAHSVDL